MLKVSSQLKSVEVQIDDRVLDLWELTGTERDRYETSLVNVDENGKITLAKDDVKAKLLHLSLRDKDGKPAFASVAELGKLPARSVNALYEAARKLSGIDDGTDAKKG